MIPHLRAAGAVRSVRSFLLASGRRLESTAVVNDAVGRDEESVLQTATRKVESLIASSEKGRSDSADPLLKTLVPFVKNGMLTTSDLLHGVQEGRMTQRDLRSLVEMQALSPVAQQHIQTALHQGTSRLSVLEVLELLRNELLGQEDLTLIVQKGDLGLEDVEYLVEREAIPRDVADTVVAEVQASASSASRSPFGFAKVKSMLASQQLPQSKIAPLVLSGDLHPDDLSLLVSEKLLREQDAERILSSCAADVSDVYKEAEKLAEFVGNGRFTYEELEVMRAKGVLGDALVHYLVTRNALDDEKGQRLLEIEEDMDYLDPEVTDDEAEAAVPKRNYAVKKGKDNASAAGEEISQSILETGGASDEGFYPEKVDKEDIFTLWEYLSEVYEQRPGKEEFVDMIQEMHQSVGLRQLPKKAQPLVQDKPTRHPEVDADGNAHAVGKRKSSIASITLRKGTGQMTINDKSLQEYFSNMDGRCYVLSPFLATDTLGLFDAAVTVEGGGWSGQAQAIRHGVARALQNFNPEYQEPLKELGLLKRDSRVVERKKPGRAKARKSFQWVKR